MVETKKQLFVSVGTASSIGLIKLQEIFTSQESTGSVRGSRYLALDTSKHTVDFFEEQHRGRIEALCLGANVCEGGGSGISDAVAYEAFKASYRDFADLVGPVENATGALVIGSPGKGGTAAGAMVPVCMALNNMGITTIPFVILPAIGSKAIGATQKTYCENVLSELRRHGIKAFVACEDWIYRYKPEIADLPYNKALEELYKELGLAIAGLFKFSPTSSSMLSFLDPNDLRRRVLLGDGFLKFGQVEVDLSTNSVEQITAACKEIQEQKLYKFEGPIRTVVPILEGDWTPKQMEAVFSHVDELFAESGLQEQYRFMKPQFIPTGSKRGTLSLLLSTAPQCQKPEELNSPKFELEEWQEAAGKPRATLSISSKANQPPLTRSYKTLKDLLVAAQQGSPDAVYIMSEGSPFKLGDQLIPITSENNRRLPLLRFELNQSQLGRELTEFQVVEGKRSNSILLQTVVAVQQGLPRRMLSSGWSALIVGSIELALREERAVLPRYIYNPAVGSKRELEWTRISTYDLTQDAYWIDQYARRSSIARWAMVRVCYHILFGNGENFPLPAECWEQEDNRTPAQKILQAAASMAGGLPVISHGKRFIKWHRARQKRQENPVEVAPEVAAMLPASSTNEVEQAALPPAPTNGTPALPGLEDFPPDRPITIQ